MKPHWYFITYYECPVCGSQHEVRERRYTPKPLNSWQRSKFEPWYDNCDIEIC
jgi:hypothetical protein